MVNHPKAYNFESLFEDMDKLLQQDAFGNPTGEPQSGQTKSVDETADIDLSDKALLVVDALRVTARPGKHPWQG